MKDKKKEKQIVKMLSEGKKPAEIGRSLNLTYRTVQTYLDEIRADYGAINAPHLVGIFHRLKKLD